MVERNIEERPDEESSPLILKTQAHADLRQLARKNLKEAERVLAESGYQLFKNTQEDTEPENQGLKETPQESQEKE